MSSITNIELDECWSSSKDTDHLFTVKINKGMTRRDAMAKIHHNMHAQFKSIELEAANDAAGKLQLEASKSAFKDKCIEAIKQWRDK